MLHAVDLSHVAVYAPTMTTNGTLHDPSLNDLYAMASRFGGLDIPEAVTITGDYDRAFLEQMSQQFGLTVTERPGETEVHS